MKKILVMGAIAIGTLASAFPFRTSCGKVYNITGTTGMSISAIAEFCNDVNFIACGENANIIVYYH
ncbi:hypothetical protein [Chryseobacterium sp. HMWF035]|uniref:hypothetical protein n=1 Tax=Chryseobacterium sp. HMWF035 TaxID=2056868 RepID=UPI000D583F79|nr:hypothetical protein [Chryseobacterium sp. HMWF035]PVV57492.1 hypothetical protein DD829_08545 [Chryseobacterium sp. HMWF035]